MSHDRLLRPRIAAELLGVSRSTVYRWFWEGHLKGVKMGAGTLRILESSVNEKLRFAY
jgi:excisionase family DNA binding protein